MSDHTVIAILVGTLAILAAAVGYIRVEQHRRDRQQATYIHQLEQHERQLRAQDALIHAIAEDYDSQPPTPTHRKLPEGWRVIDGGGVLLLLALLGRWVSRHWRTIAAAATAAGAASVLAVAILGHGTPPVHRQLFGPTAAAPTDASAVEPSAAVPAAPTTKPGRAPYLIVSAFPAVSMRRRPVASTSPEPATAPPSPGRPTPPPRPSPSRSTAPPTPSPTITCPLGLTLRLLPIGVTVCI